MCTPCGFDDVYYIIVFYYSRAVLLARSRKTVTKAQECNGRECRGVGVRRAGLLGLGAWRAGVAAPDAAGAGVAAPEAGKGKARSVVPAGD
jgi:hypothetical protein